MTKREFLDTVFALAPNEANAIMDAFDEYVDSNEPHWIPVTERLPEDSVYVLLTVRRMDDSYNHVPFISTGYISWNHQCWWCAHDGNCKDANIDVLAWMPLPEPYKESEVAT